MKCPVCEIEMRIADREGVEIDYCPQCRGVWLDRGELEKIVARTSPANDDDYDSHDDDDHHGERRRARYADHDERHYHGKKREGFWGNIMDIFD